MATSTPNPTSLKCDVRQTALSVAVDAVVQAQSRERKGSRRAPGYDTLIGAKAPPAEHDSNDSCTLLFSYQKRRSHLVFEQQPNLVSRIFYHGCCHGCCPVRATGGSLPCGHYLLSSLNKEESKDLLVLRVKPTLTRFLPSILYTPVVGTLLYSIANVFLRLQRQEPTGRQPQ